MNKKIIITFIIAILIIIVGIIGYITMKNNSTENNEQLNKESSTNVQSSMEQSNNKELNESESNNITNNSKIAVIYFSATGTTKGVAEKIANVTNSDIIEIIPKDKYTSSDLNYGNDNSRANQEQNSSSARPEIANDIDVNKYDVIYLGYPIWWGNIPKIILTFLDTNNLDGKTIIPFCTSGSTDISQSQSTLESYNKNTKLLKGKRFSSSVNEKELTDWIKELNL